MLDAIAAATPRIGEPDSASALAAEGFDPVTLAAPLDAVAPLPDGVALGGVAAPGVWVT